jgi:hypothetical protein
MEGAAQPGSGGANVQGVKQNCELRIANREVRVIRGLFLLYKENQSTKSHEIRDS